jgi:predicted dehydrogenase
MPRIAVLSTAHIHSESFLKQLQERTEHGAPYVIWDANAERGQAYAQQFGSRFEADLDAVIADDEIQGFLICAENTRHLPLLERALATGKPTMCEKPLTTSLAEAQRVAELVATHGAPLISGYFMPFNAAAQGVAQLVEAGAFGKITHVAHRNAHSAAYGRWFDNPKLAWFTDPALSGGGALLDLGTHSVHFLRSLFGPVDQVFATISNLSGIYDQVDDYGTLLLRFRSGILGRVEAGWVQKAGRGGLEIFGDQQALWQDGGFKLGDGKETKDVAEAPAKPDRVARLIELVRGRLPDAEWKADLAAALDAVAIMEAAYASAQNGTWIDVAATEAVSA